VPLVRDLLERAAAFYVQGVRRRVEGTVRLLLRVAVPACVHFAR
jgi:hypothetical protein